MTDIIDWNAVERNVLSQARTKSGLKAEQLRERIDPEPVIKAMLQLVTEADTVDLADLPRLRFKHEVLTTVLKKVMPDLRSLEVSEKDSKYSTLVIQMDTKI